MIRKVFSRFLILAALFTPGVRAESPTWTAGFDVDLGLINGVAAARGIAYAATHNGVFRSDDGRAWKEAGLQGRLIGSVVMDTAGETVYALEPFGTLWASFDGGAHWQVSGPGAPVSVLVADPREPNTVWTDSHMTSDRGAHWAPVDTPVDDYGIYFLAIDPNDGTMYAQTFDLSMYTKAPGAAWQAAGSLNVSVTSVIASASTAGVIYAATYQGVCRSTDHGATWSCPQNAPASGGKLVELPPEGSLPPRLLWAAGARLLISDDGANAWRAVSAIGSDPSDFTSLAVDKSSGRVYAGRQNVALRCEDRGESWSGVPTGLRAAWIESLGSGSDALWAASGTPVGSLFTRTDDAQSWSTETLPGQPVAISSMVVDPGTSTVYAGGGYALFRKTRGGAWTRNPLSHIPSALAVDPGNSESVWLGTDEGVTHSADGGQTWSPMQVAQSVYALVVDPRDPNRIYAGSWEEYSCPFGCYPFGGALFSSGDGGETWTKNGGLESTVTELVFDPFDSHLLYAGTFMHGVASTRDGGATWRLPLSYPPGELTALVADPTRPDTLYVGTSQGVHRSRDRGRSWLPFGEGLPRLDVRSLAISTDGRFLHAGTAGLGVFDLALEDEPVAGFPCVPGPSRLCLLGNRFQVDLIVQAKGGGEPENGAAHALGDRAGYFAIPAFTGDGAAPEVVVKMLPDGAFGVDGSPILYSSMTGASFVLRVTDTVEGIESVYRSDSSRPFCGGADLVSINAAGSERKAATIPAPVAQGLSLLGGRFTVSLEARTRSGKVAAGVPFASGDRYGFFSLPGITGDPGLPELVVKMLDGRGFNDAFWVFRGSLTGLEYTLTVHDERTGETRTYENGEPFCGAGDIQAFHE